MKSQYQCFWEISGLDFKNFIQNIPLPHALPFGLYVLIIFSLNWSFSLFFIQWQEVKYSKIMSDLHWNHYKEIVSVSMTMKTINPSES